VVELERVVDGGWVRCLATQADWLGVIGVLLPSRFREFLSCSDRIGENK
jgi:hypothetical protein